MEPTEHPGESRRSSFEFGRVRHHDAGELSGVGERVNTGEEVQLHGLETLDRPVASLLSTEAGGS
jgi:hypothetical protein